jgi:hypothetical protein
MNKAFNRNPHARRAEPGPTKPGEGQYQVPVVSTRSPAHGS